jgi:hypothetical protein
MKEVGKMILDRAKDIKNLQMVAPIRVCIKLVKCTDKESITGKTAKYTKDNG